MSNIDIYAYFRFLGDLNFFLSGDQKDQTIRYPLDGDEAVKHPIESLGIPHPEVGKIEVSGLAVPFEYRVQPQDNVLVYPWTSRPPVGHAGRLRAPAPRPLRFVLDTHLGQLARYLRLLGCDALYENDYDDATLAAIAAEQQRVLLTRDRGLLKRSIVVHGHCIRQTDPRSQLIAVVQRYDLVSEIVPWRRCLRCNGLLQPVQKEEVLAVLEPKTRRYYDEFQQCQECGQVYWRGSHFERMQAFVEEIIEACEKMNHDGTGIA